MTRKTAKLDKPKTRRAKAPRKVHSCEVKKPRGRKAAAATKKHKTPPGRAAVRLRSSVNSLVSYDSDRIVQALIDKTVAGNMTGARLIVELSGADHPPAAPKKKRSGKSLLDELESGPQWDPSMDRDASQLPPSEPDDLDDPSLPTC
jgi:hypothetical protein